MEILQQIKINVTIFHLTNMFERLLLTDYILLIITADLEEVMTEKEDTSVKMLRGQVMASSSLIVLIMASSAYMVAGGTKGAYARTVCVGNLKRGQLYSGRYFKSRYWKMSICIKQGNKTTIVP
jgi:hypothetical protein